MDDDYTIESSDNLTTIRLKRDLDIDQLFALVDRVAEVDKFDRRLWDLSCHFSFNGAQVRQLAEYGRQKWPGPAKVAYIASNDLSFGLLRMFEVHRSEENYQTKIFRSEKEALAWFASDDV